MSFQFDPLFVLTCHRTLGVGEPLAPERNVTLAPAHFVWLDGLVVIPGAELMLNVAAVVASLPHELVNTARY
jgi:hypothetical protein